MPGYTKYTFVDPVKILAFAGFEKGQTVADFGCGNGYYPVAAAQLVGDTGMVYAVDVKPGSLEATSSAAKHQNLRNIYTLLHDMEKPGVPIEENTCDSVILSGIMHLAKLQKNILRESYRILKTGGSVIIIEWKKEVLPFGPNINDRVAEDAMREMVGRAGFQYKKPNTRRYVSLRFNIYQINFHSDLCSHTTLPMRTGLLFRRMIFFAIWI